MNINISKKEAKYHIITWFFICSWLGFINPVPGSKSAMVFGTILILVANIITFYSILYILIRTWPSGIPLTFMSLSLFYLIYFFTNYLIFNITLPNWGSTYLMDLSNVRAVLYELYTTLLSYTIFMLMALAYFFNKISDYKIQLAVDKEKSLHMKEAEVLQREKDLLNKELTYIKSQFSSHITFNLINYIYGFIYNNKEASNALGTFSDFIRYNLDLKPGVSVRIKNEVKNIKDFIRLQKIVSSKVQVKFRTKIVKDRPIKPYILIPLIENAFKHGLSHDPKVPIEINLTSDDQITLIVKNQISKKRIISTGLGLKNLKENLELNYPNNYNLEILNQHDCYEVKLIIYDHDKNHNS